MTGIAAYGFFGVHGQDSRLKWQRWPSVGARPTGIAGAAPTLPHRSICPGRRTQRVVSLAIIAFVIAGVVEVKSAEKVQRETIEWCNIRWEYTNDRKLPRVLLIGDSIVVGYSAHVKKLLKGKAHVDMLATSKCLSDPAFLKETKYALEDYQHAVVHVNNGLHGWHQTDEQYEAALRDYVKKLKQLAKDSRLVWATTTPVPSRRKGTKLEKKRNGIVLARNAIAEKVMADNGVAINDLYALVIDDLEQLSASKGNVHYNEDGKSRQGKAAAEAIRASLKE